MKKKYFLAFAFSVALKIIFFFFFLTRFTLPYREEDYPVQIKQKQDLCFRASVKSEDKNLSVLVENCFATSSKNTYLAAKYYLVKNG